MRVSRVPERLPPARRAALPRLCAGAIASLGWTGLGIELGVTIASASARNESIAAALARLFSFFTIQTNLLLALLLTVAARRPDSIGVLARPSVRSAAVVYILIVGAVYAVLLSHLYHLSGVVLFADRLLHTVIPVLYPLYWLAFAPKGGIGWTDVFLWLVFPLLYFIYSLIRGALIGAYPYPFLDVAKLGYGQVVLNALALLAAFLAVGLVVAAIDRALGGRKRRGPHALGSAADF